MLNIISATRHAQDRYQIHYPDAAWTDVLAAARLSLPMEPHVAFSLAGRRVPATLEPGQEFRLHPLATGVFVICQREEDPTTGYVRTYLRLYGKEQREFAIRMLLDPVVVLKEAFELGFREGRRAEGPPTALQASEQNLPALVALAPRFAEEIHRHRTAADQPLTALSLLPGDSPDPSPAATPTIEITEVGLIPKPLPTWAEQLSTNFLQRVVALRRSNPKVNLDLTSWQPLPPAMLPRLHPHFPSEIGQASAVFLEPSGFHIAVLPGGDELARLYSVPKACREAVIRASRAGAPSPSTPHASPSAPAPAVAETSASSHPAPEGVAQAVFVAPQDLDVESWEPKALREAAVLGFDTFPVQWIDQLTPCTPEEGHAIALRQQWSLQETGRYAVYRSQEVALLIGEDNGRRAATILRVGRLVSLSAGADNE